MVIRVGRGMSAPPEVVFNTATDPDRLAAWLPVPLRMDGNRPTVTVGDLRARWTTPESTGWSAELQVCQADAGGAMVGLALEADLSDRQLVEIADRSLTALARHVADNLTAG